MQASILALLALTFIAVLASLSTVFLKPANECSGLTEMECQYFKANVNTLASYNDVSYSQSKEALLENQTYKTPVGFFALEGDS